MREPISRLIDVVLGIDAVWTMEDKTNRRVLSLDQTELFYFPSSTLACRSAMERRKQDRKELILERK